MPNLSTTISDQKYQIAYLYVIWLEINVKPNIGSLGISVLEITSLPKIIRGRPPIILLVSLGLMNTLKHGKNHFELMA